MRRHLLLAVAGLVIATSARAQQSPCRERFIKICDGQDGDTSPLCEMLKQDAAETPESIEQFLMSISGVSESVRQDLICARLLGSKKVVNLQATLASPLAFKTGNGLWRLDIRDPLYGELIASQGKLADLGKVVSDQAVVDVAGFINSVSIDYVRGEFSSFRINIAQAELSSIKTQYANGDVVDIVRALKLRIREAYKTYMTIGLDNKGAPGFRFLLKKPE
jgi:hypothetical protein